MRRTPSSLQRSPFLKPNVQEAEITNMIKAFGAPIDDKDAKTIHEYLVKDDGG